MIYSITYDFKNRALVFEQDYECISNGKIVPRRMRIARPMEDARVQKEMMKGFIQDKVKYMAYDNFTLNFESGAIECNKSVKWDGDSLYPAYSLEIADIILSDDIKEMGEQSRIQTGYDEDLYYDEERAEALGMFANMSEEELKKAMEELKGKMPDRPFD